MVTKPQGLRVDLPFDRIEEFCRRWRVVELAVFGSALRDDFGAGSDVDFLYSFAPGTHWGWAIVDMEDDLRRIVGRPIDLISRKAVERSAGSGRNRTIIESARTIYVA